MRPSSARAASATPGAPAESVAVAARANRIASKHGTTAAGNSPARQRASARPDVAAIASRDAGVPRHASNARANSGSASGQSPRSARMRARQSDSPAATHRGMPSGRPSPRTARTSLHGTVRSWSSPALRMRTTAPAPDTDATSHSIDGAPPRNSTSSAREAPDATASAAAATAAPSRSRVLHARPVVRPLMAAPARARAPHEPAGTRRRPPAPLGEAGHRPPRRRTRSR